MCLSASVSYQAPYRWAVNSIKLQASVALVVTVIRGHALNAAHMQFVNAKTTAEYIKKEVDG